QSIGSHRMYPDPQQSLIVAHVSDIHYGMSPRDPSKSAHYFVSKGEPDPRQLSSLISNLEPLDADPDVFVISGDIGQSAAERDYKYAAEFLSKQRERWKNCVFVMVPGNHDVDVSPTLDLDVRQASIERLFRNFYGDKFDELFPFYSWH